MMHPEIPYTPHPMEAPPAPRPMQVRLQHRQRGHLVAEWCFDRAFRIGCDAACDVRLDDLRVDPQHAEVYTDGATWRVRDLGGRVDTFVNGAQIKEARLGNPSVVQIGWNGPVLHVTFEPADETTAKGLLTANLPVAPTRPAPHPRPAKPRRPIPAPAPASLPKHTPRFQGHGFTMPLPDQWHDRTLYTLAGPMADGIRHTVLVETDAAPQTQDLKTYAEKHITALKNDLAGFRLVRRDTKTMTDGKKAVRVIYAWRPNRHRVFFQEQLYVLHEGQGYKLTTSFTNTSRKEVGPQIEAVMLGFSVGSG